MRGYKKYKAVKLPNLNKKKGGEMKAKREERENYPKYAMWYIKNYFLSEMQM